MKMESLITGSLVAMQVVAGYSQKAATQHPNILVCIADDQSYPHAGAYGCKWVKTPAFDRVAREGILFTNAFTPNAKCSPSRSCILTGRTSWQLEAAANHVPYFPAKFKTYAETLLENGYHVGYTAKGWAPGDPGKVNGKQRELLGPAYSTIKTIPPAKFISEIDYTANFEAFLKDNRGGKPFCFWFGSTEPHRPYEFRAGASKGGKSASEIEKIFGFWPDNDTVRNDLLDYAFEIEYFDSHIGKMLKVLEDKGLLDNTIVIITADNGMPFPRIKGNGYMLSNHLPLAIRWPKGISNPGREVSDFVSFTDFAPTFLEVAGVKTAQSGMEEMEGRSLLPLLEAKQVGKFREFMVIGKERTDLGRPDDQGYPIRGIVGADYLYLRNYHPERWPAGNPETGYMDCDGSPTKSYILNDRRSNGESYFWDMNFGKHPEEELFQLTKDQECLVNLADQPVYAEIKAKMVRQMEKKLREDRDPRILGNGAIFDTYPYSEEKQRNYYNRWLAGEKLNAGWIEQSDVERAGLIK